MDDKDTDTDQEALRLKSTAETKYTNSNLKSALKYAKKAHKLNPNLEGVSSMLTAFKLLRLASKSRTWYSILEVEPFSHINTIRKQYKKLALILHPDKNPFVGCEEAFKLVGEGFRVLSDKIRRKEYDMRLRIRLQEERVSGDNEVEVETFWTACSRCRLLHQFDRRYLGHNLVCPSCKISFEAVEVEVRHDDDDDIRVKDMGLKRKVGGGDKQCGQLGAKRKTGVVGSRVKVKSRGVDVVEELGIDGVRRNVSGRQKERQRREDAELEVKEDGSGRCRSVRRKMSTVDEVLERSKQKKVEFVDEMMTLAEMQLEARKKTLLEKERLNDKKRQKEVTENGGEEEEDEKLVDLKKLKGIKRKQSEIPKEREMKKLEARTSLDQSTNLESERCGASRKSADLKIERYRGLRNRIMAVKDSEFDKFEMDRVEKSIKQGQVWAIYDGERKPRHYGLVNEVISMNPFAVRLSLLDYQFNGDETLMRWKKSGFNISCGKFKVSRTKVIKSLNRFSHVVDCERAAREAYNIYPKKGSIWALYNEEDTGAGESSVSDRNKQYYEIVVCLTTYNEIYGLSMAYLEKVDGFNTVFKRREIGPHAVRFLEKDDILALSHQIPARKLSADEIPALLKECWQLDPALLKISTLTAEKDCSLMLSS